MAFLVVFLCHKARAGTLGEFLLAVESLFLQPELTSVALSASEKLVVCASKSGVKGEGDGKKSEDRCVRPHLDAR